MDDFESFNPHIRRTMAVGPNEIEAVKNAAVREGAVYHARRYRSSEGDEYYLVSFDGGSLTRTARLLEARRNRSKLSQPDEQEL